MTMWMLTGHFFLQKTTIIPVKESDKMNNKEPVLMSLTFLNHTNVHCQKKKLFKTPANI